MMTLKRRDSLLLAAAMLPGLAQAADPGNAPRRAKKKGESLEDKIDRLTGMVQRLHDVNEIQNLVGRMAYLYEAGMYEERLALVAQKTPGVTIEIGVRGVFEGFAGARRVMVDVEKDFEHSHALGMRKAFPDVKFDGDHAGMLESELMGTPVVEVAGDGQTAKGEWLSLMAVGKTHENDPKPHAMWLWWKTAVDFVKEDGQWKVWHYLKNPMFLSPYDKDWVQNSLTLPPAPPPGTVDALGTHGHHPDRPTTRLYDSYRITRQPRLDPKPPEPYETFDPKDSYSW